MIFWVLFSSFWRFWSFLGDIGHFLRPDLGGEVGRWLPTLDIYKPGLIEAKGEDSKQVYAEDFPSQSHFYAGKLLRSAPLRAISRSSGHPIWVSFLLLGSRDLVEQDQINFVTFWQDCDVLIELWTQIRKPHPLRQRPRDISEIVELRYHIGVMVFCCFMSQFSYVYEFMAMI